MTHDFFSDRTNGPAPRVADDISEVVWNGLVALIYSRLDGQWLAHSFPIECADGNGIVDTNRNAFITLLQALVPAAPWPLTGNGVPDAPVVFDVVEFVAGRVAKAERGQWHDFLRHHELTFDSRAGRRAFRREVNQLLARNGIAYEMNKERQIVRLGPPEGRSIIADLRPQTRDATLDQLILSSRVRFLSRDIADRPIALQNIWDAFERIKTIEPGPGKQASMPALLDKVAVGRMRDFLEQESRALSSIGNTTQIRHFEVDKPALREAEIDYLYVRMTSFLLHLLRSLDLLEG